MEITQEASTDKYLGLFVYMWADQKQDVLLSEGYSVETYSGVEGKITIPG
jgi:hypothetical protein